MSNNYGPLPQFGNGGTGSGSVTSVSVDNVNGLSGTVLNPTTTPVIRLKSNGVSAYITTINYVVGNIIRGDGTNGSLGVLYECIANTTGAYTPANWSAIISSGTVTSSSIASTNGITVTNPDPTGASVSTIAFDPIGILKSNGTTISAAIASDFPILNQDTTGNASTATSAASLSTNLPVTNLNSGTGASSGTFWRGDATWATVPGEITGLTTNGVAYATSATTIGSTAVGGTGQVLTSQGALLPPVWANSPAASGGVDPYDPAKTYNKGQYIAGDGVNGFLGAIYVALIDNITGTFNISDWAINVGLDLTNFNTYSATFSTANTVSGQYNTFNGYNSGTAPTLSGNYNVAFGPFAFTSNSTITGQKNAGFGGSTANGGITSASFNTWCGFGSSTALTTGNYNINLGYGAGSNVDIGTANILIGDLGTSGAFDNNLRISNPQNNNEIIVVNDTDQPIPANMVLASPLGSAGPMSPRQITAADILSFSDTFNATTDWGTPSGGIYTISIPSVTHGQGVNVVNVQIFETSGANLILTTVNQVIIDSTNGDVSFNVPETPDARFAGKICIIGAA